MMNDTDMKSVVRTICCAQRLRIKSQLHNLKNKSTRMPFRWSTHQEICLARVLLRFSMEAGKADITAMFNRANNDNNINGSSPFRSRQVRDKIRNMKSRYHAITSNLKKSNIPEEEYGYRTLHEADLFKIWKQIWGKDNNNNNNKNNNTNGFAVAQEIPKHMSCLVSNPISIPNANRNGYDERKRNTMLGNEQLKLEGLVDGLLKRTNVVAGHLHSVKGLLTAANGGKTSEKKFRDHVVRKLQLYAQGLELLREECTLGFENLGRSEL